MAPGEPAPRRLSLSIETRLENVALVGVAVRGVGRLLGLDEIDANRIELCVVEAVTNVIRHASPGSPHATVDTRLGVHAHRLEIRVEARGASGPGLELGPGWGREPDATEERGRGLALIRTIMDRVEFGVEGETQVLVMVKELLPGRSGAG